MLALIMTLMLWTTNPTDGGNHPRKEEMAQPVRWNYGHPGKDGQ